MSDTTLAHVEALLARGEGPTLDFKEGAPPLTSKEGRAQFAKDVLAFANSVDIGEQAHILYGVQDPRRGGGVKEGATIEWPTPEQVTQVLADYTAPPPRTSFRVISTATGNVGVLSIIGVTSRPHHAARSHDGVLSPNIVYLRRDQVNGIATSREIERMIRLGMGEGGTRADQAPLRIGFVGRDRSSGTQALLVRVTNVTDTPVAGIEVLIDFEHMSERGLSARHGLLTNMFLGPGESREATFEPSQAQMTLRVVAPGTPPQMLRVLADRLGSFVGDRWLNATLRVYYRDRDGFLRQLTSELALDG
jgi:hypothetical protein